MKLGILGGTFDPIHFGHLRLAEEIYEKLDLEKVYLIPGAVPPHKDPRPITPFPDRLSMTQAAVDEAPFLDVLDLEGHRSGFSYTIETLKDLHRQFHPGTEFYFIIGMDAFKEIKTWKDYKELFDLTHFVVIKRPGFPSVEWSSFVISLDAGFQRQGPQKEACFMMPNGNRLIYMETTCLDISSSRIRKMVSDGNSIRFLVPEPVRLYIMEKGLYLKHGNP